MRVGLDISLPISTMDYYHPTHYSRLFYVPHDPSLINHGDTKYVISRLSKLMHVILPTAALAICNLLSCSSWNVTKMWCDEDLSASALVMLFSYGRLVSDRLRGWSGMWLFLYAWGEVGDGNRWICYLGWNLRKSVRQYLLYSWWNELYPPNGSRFLYVSGRVKHYQSCFL